MAQQKNLYRVGYGQNQGEPVVLDGVDLFHLPHDKATPDDPLVIFFAPGEEHIVDMGRCKNRPWPDFRNVCIDGALDCQDFPINASTVLPTCFDKLICRHSINDLGVLIGLLPADFMTAPEPTVVVRTAVLNNVKNNKDGAMDVARRFMQMYPNVMVTDEKKLVLAEIIAEHDRAQSESKNAKIPVSKKTVKKTVVPPKNEQWLATDEMVARCKAASQVIAAMDTDQVARYIQMARSAKAGLRLNTSQCMRADGAVLNCIHVDDVMRVAEFIVNTVSEQEQQKTVKNTDKKPADKTVQAPQNKEEKYYFNDKEIKPVKIKKYISKTAFGQIKAKCGTSTSDLLRILNDIENINVNPTLTAGEQVIFIQDKQIKISPTVKFKNARCLCQGFGTLDDRPRIVWGVSGNFFVCQKFFATHDTRDKKYNHYLNEINVNVAELDLSEYLYVPDMIAEMAVAKEAVAAPRAPEEKPVVVDTPQNMVIAEKIKDDKDIQTIPAIQPVADAEQTPGDTIKPIAPQKKRGRPRCTERTVADAQPTPELTPEQIPEPIVPNTAESNVEWAELYSIHGKYKERMNVLNTTQTILIQQLGRETDTDKLIKTTKNLQYVLEQKQECERAMRKIQHINMALKRMQQMLEEHKI